MSATNDSPEQRGYEFPGSFEVTVVGEAGADLDAILAECVAAQGLTLLSGSARTRPSRGGRYVATSVSFLCPDREHLERVYTALRAYPAVRWTL